MRRLWVMAALAVSMGGVLPVQAGFYQDLYRGLGYYATPSGTGLQQLADGSVINGARLGRLAIVPNRPGNGYELQIDRSFGVDSRGRPEVLDLGAFEIELSGGTQATLGYTEQFGFYTGNAEFIANNLQYRTAVKTGAIDATVTGTLNVANTVEINQLGFYTMQVNVSNDDSELVFDSISDYESEPLDYDIGPITVRGNVFFDLFVGILGSLGVDTTGLETLTPKSPIDQIVDAMQTELEAQGIIPVSDGDLVAGEFFVFESDVLGSAAAAPPADEETPAAPEPTEAPQSNVPEPSTLMLVLLGAAGLKTMGRRGA